jgi:EAL domain-containing protein (putative c-di-GMP-specific phosphodiesterase class I)
MLAARLREALEYDHFRLYAQPILALSQENPGPGGTGLAAVLADYVKVDGTVIRDILRSGSSAAKLEAILRVGQVTGVKVIAECVEEEKVLAALKALKADYAQGFGVHKPEPIDDLFKS